MQIFGWHFQNGSFFWCLNQAVDVTAGLGLYECTHLCSCCPLSVSALCYRTTMCITLDKFSPGFYWKQMAWYYVGDTVGQ